MYLVAFVFPIPNFASFPRFGQWKCDLYNLQSSLKKSWFLPFFCMNSLKIKGYLRPKRIDYVPKHHKKPHQEQHSHQRSQYAAPVYWERPYFPNWDPNVHYANYHSQDDNYFDDCCKHQHTECWRNDSDSNVSANQPQLMPSSSNYGSYCWNRFYKKSPPHQCFSCETSTSSLAVASAKKVLIILLPLECALFCNFESNSHTHYQYGCTVSDKSTLIGVNWFLPTFGV